MLPPLLPATHPEPILTQDPEDGRTRAGQPEEGKGDTPSQSILMGWAYLSAWGADGIGAAVLTLMPSPRVSPDAPPTVWGHKLQEPQDRPNSSCQGPPSPGLSYFSDVPTAHPNRAQLPYQNTPSNHAHCPSAPLLLGSSPPPTPPNYGSPPPICTHIDQRSQTGHPMAKSDLWMRF